MFRVIFDNGELKVISNNGTILPVSSCCDCERMKLRTISYLKSLPTFIDEKQLIKKYETLHNH